MCSSRVQSLEVVSFYRVGVVANRGGRTPCIEREQLCMGYILYRSASNTYTLYSSASNTVSTAEWLNGSSWGCFGDQMLMLGANINTGCYHYYHYVIIIGINNQLTNKYNQTNTIVI